jgi:hypothetical protein
MAGALCNTCGLKRKVKISVTGNGQFCIECRTKNHFRNRWNNSSNLQYETSRAHYVADQLKKTPEDRKRHEDMVKRIKNQAHLEWKQYEMQKAGTL